MSANDLASKRLSTLRGLAGVCQCLPATINILRDAIDGQTHDGSGALIRLAGWYAPVCRKRCLMDFDERRLLDYALAMYRTVSRGPRRLGGIYAPSATEALLLLAQHIVQTAETFAHVGLEGPAQERRRPDSWQLDRLANAWPAIRDELATISLPNKKQLEKYRVEPDYEWGQALLRWEAQEESEPPRLSPPVPPLPVIRSMGNSSYCVGNASPIKVSDREDTVLQAFLQRSPLDKSALASLSGYEAETAVNILRALKGTKNRPAKYGGILSHAVRMPGKKGAGGYHVNIQAQAD